MTPDQILAYIVANIEEATEEVKVSPEMVATALKALHANVFASKVLTVFITTGGMGVLTSGPLQSGTEYIVLSVEEGDDFTGINAIGAFEPGVRFIYNGDTIPEWSNGTEVLELGAFKEEMTTHVAFNSTAADIEFDVIAVDGELGIRIMLSSIIGVLTNSIDISTNQDTSSPFNRIFNTQSFFKPNINNLTQFHTTFRIYPEHDVTEIGGGGFGFE